MSAAISVIMILGFIVIYNIIIEIYSVIFRMTGLTKEKSLFQTISLLTNSGFTTQESEIIANNKLRRRIATLAMITGYAFSVVIVSLIINLLLKLNMEQADNTLIIVLISFAAFILIMIVSKIPFTRKLFDKIVEGIASKILKKSKNNNVITQLDNYGKDAICEIVINFVPELLYNKPLYKTNLKTDYNINILMLKRKNRVVDVTKDTIFQKGDSIVIFGSLQNIKDIFGPSGNKKEVEEVLEKFNLENEIDLIDNYGKDAMAEVTVNRLPDQFKDTTLFRSRIKEDNHCTVLVVKRDDMPITIDKDTIIKKGDKITLFGPYLQIKKVFLDRYKDRDINNY